MNERQIARKIFFAAVEKVKPNRLIQENVQWKNRTLYVAGQPFPVSREGKIVVSGAGKATALMAWELEKILGPDIAAGHIVVKYGHTVPLKYIGCTESGHPVPDANGIDGTQKVVETISGLSEKDIHICLLSGGGSALLADEPPGATLADIMQLNELLLKCGADIAETNAVRKHLSAVKGGQLARLAAPATTISLILSDVIDDPLDVIASGPTAPDSSTFSEVWTILGKYAIAGKLPSSILKILTDGKNGILPETPKGDDPLFRHVHNYIIGNNRIALNEAARVADSYGFKPVIVTSNMNGECSDAARYIGNEIRQRDASESICLLFGGETTVQVNGSGKGGRNQHLALLMAHELYRQSPRRKITVLCAGTDGSDGPTDATGAIVDQSTWNEALKQEIDIAGFIRNNDSYNFFKGTENHLITGPTMTNVMDLVVVLTTKEDDPPA